MPSYVVKTSREEDFYVYWSSIVEAPVAWGDRARMVEVLAHERARRGGGDLTPDERLAWTDRHGTSARWPGGSDGYVYDWEDASLIYQQQGVLPRASLKALCERLADDEQADVGDLLKPFED